MKFCLPHWEVLREAIESRGLSVLISETGAEASRKFMAQLQEGGQSIDNFDPLMDAHNLIAMNALNLIAQTGANPLYLLAPDGAPEDRVEGYGSEFEGRTWPRCPICYLNLAHEITCKDSRCQLPKKTGYDWMIGRAADDQVAAWKAMKP